MSNSASGFSGRKPLLRTTPLGDATGNQIRTTRTARGISVRELARRAGISPSLVSQVERGLTEPSISSLRRIAEALDVSIFSLLEETDGRADDNRRRSVDSRIVRTGQRRRVSLPHSGLRYELLSPDVPLRMEAWIAMLEPGASTGDTKRGHPGEEFMHVLSGGAELEYGDEAVTLRESDSVHVDGSIPHRLTALGNRRLVFLSVLTPPVL